MLGFSVHEIAVILLGEQAVLVMLGIPAGFGLGIAVRRGVDAGAERRSVPDADGLLGVARFVLSAAVIVVMAALAGLAVRRRLSHLDLVAVLKSRE